MNPLIQLTKAIPVSLVALICIGLSPTSRAVTPPPDGGYPGFTTAEGQNALLSLTTGSANTAVGWLSLKSNTDGSFNTAVGAGTLVLNIGDQAMGEGIENTAIGTAALLLNTTGSGNTATGVSALQGNTVGNGNTAVGFNALPSNTTGSVNTAIGDAALLNNTTGGFNTAIGFATLINNTTINGIAGEFNTANGYHALSSNTTGSNNTAIGNNALANNTTGINNTALGAGAGFNVTTANNTICIGDISGANVDSSCFIGNIRGVTTANADAIPVLIDSAGQLGTTSSSRQFKKEIKPMDSASETILALRPVTFHYKGDKTDTPQFGLIAEEVAEVNPDLVVRDRNGEIYTVRYDAVNAMLLNEFLKEHRKNEEQQATITRLDKQVEALTAGLQKVSAQLEVSKPAPQTVLK